MATTAAMKRSVSCLTTTTNITTAEPSIESTPTSNSKRKKCTILPSNDKSIDTTENNTGLNILIVDDNPININIMKRSLQKLLETSKIQIKRIEEARNGIEALNMLNQYPFDIILLDIDMPILNGIDTTKCIRKKGQTIPIIAVTTNDSIESRDNYIKIGMNDCLSKPVDIKLLEETLLKVLLLLPPSPSPSPCSPSSPSSLLPPNV